MSEGTCTTCGAEVFMHEHIATRVPMLFDRQWRDGGSGFVMTPDGAVYAKNAPTNRGVRTYVSHAETCKSPTKHAKGGGNG